MIGLLIDIPPVVELIPAVAVRMPAILRVLLNTIDPPALNINDRLPLEPVSLIGELTKILPVPVPPTPSVKPVYAAPASSVSDTVCGLVRVIALSVPPAVAPTKIFPCCVPLGLNVMTVTDVPLLRVLLIVETGTTELSVSGTQMPALQLEDGGDEAVFVIVMSRVWGRGAESPGMPLGAEALTEAAGPTTS